jgi:hypothetical protein
MDQFLIVFSDGTYYSPAGHVTDPNRAQFFSSAAEAQAVITANRFDATVARWGGNDPLGAPGNRNQKTAYGKKVENMTKPNRVRYAAALKERQDAHGFSPPLSPRVGQPGFDNTPDANGVTWHPKAIYQGNWNDEEQQRRIILFEGLIAAMLFIGQHVLSAATTDSSQLAAVQSMFTNLSQQNLDGDPEELIPRSELINALRGVADTAQSGLNELTTFYAYLGQIYNDALAFVSDSNAQLNQVTNLIGNYNLRRLRKP